MSASQILTHLSPVLPTIAVYWSVGGTDPKEYEKAKAEGKVHELPVNHNPKFAPVLHPTLSTGVEAMVVATLAWNAKHG